MRLVLVCALLVRRTGGNIQRWTLRGCECELPFAYMHYVFHDCTMQNWPGVMW